MTNGTNDVANNSTSKSSSSKAPAHEPLIDPKNADAFQSSVASFWDWVEHNAKLVVALFVVGALGAAGYLVAHYLGRYQERAAQDAFYAVEAKFQKTQENFERAKMKTLMPQMAQQDPASANATPATGDLQKDYGTQITDLEKVAREHSGTAAGAQASILAAQTYLEYKQPEKAIEIAQISANKMGANHMLGLLSKMVWGNALVAKGDCQAAVGVYQQVLDNKQASYLYGDASLRSGLCYEQMNQNDKAMEMYRKATADAGDSAAGSTAKGLLRALELKAAPQAPSKQG